MPAGGPYRVVLIERTTGVALLADCHEASADERRQATWYGFNWASFAGGVEVYAVSVEDAGPVEGMLALEPLAGWVEIRLMAVAPRNRGREGIYRVGGALFGVACRRSFEEGFEGYVALDAKTVLAAHYAKEYGAQVISSRGAPRMIIESEQSAAIVERYVRD